jgi:hypothetical protein
MLLKSTAVEAVFRPGMERVTRWLKETPRENRSAGYEANRLDCLLRRIRNRSSGRPNNPVKTPDAKGIANQEGTSRNLQKLFQTVTAFPILRARNSSPRFLNKHSAEKE